MLDIVVGGAALGLFSGALVNVLTSRAANITIDLATEEVDRVVAKLKGHPKDPETIVVLHALAHMDLEAHVRMAIIAVENLKDDSHPLIQECVKEIKGTIKRIEDDLRDIVVELKRHQQRFLKTWLMSNVRPMLEPLQSKVDILDAKVNLLLQVRTCVSVTMLHARAVAIDAVEQADDNNQPASTDTTKAS